MSIDSLLKSSIRPSTEGDSGSVEQRIGKYNGYELYVVGTRERLRSK